jgi:hypothetical protein
MSYADATLIAAHLARLDWTRVYVLDTRRYAANYLSAAQVDSLPWPALRDALPTLWRGKVPGTRLDAIAVPKSVTWSDRDLNLYLGAPRGPTPKSYLDLDENTFVAAFAWQLATARRAAAELGRDVYVTHGFNPSDSCPDGHSVSAKFHTHVHVPDLSHRRRVGPGELTRFERLCLIEPYAVIAADRAAHLLADQPHPPRWRLAPGAGCLWASTHLDGQIGDDLRSLWHLLAGLNLTYQQLVDVFTDQTVEQATGHHRCVPRSTADRRERLDAFTDRHTTWLSAESHAVLRYLARALRPAAPRDTLTSLRLGDAGQAWIATGPAGALGFVVPAVGDVLRFALAPRVISTSGVTKILGPDPVIIRKDRGPATAAQQRRMTAFHHTVLAAMGTAHSVASAS